MKNSKMFIAMLLLALPLFATFAEAQNLKMQRVATAEGLLRALTSNSHIIISEGCEIILADALENDALCDILGIKEIDLYQAKPSDFARRPALRWTDNFDGRQLVVDGMKNITIEGAGKGASIIATPRYAYVLSFLGCSNIKLKNLTLGHTEEGYCQGGVVELIGSSNVVIDKCDMYGCGTEGIGATDCKNILCHNSTIRHCSYYIMTIDNCTDVVFEGCEFHHNKEFSLINIKECKNARLARCYIHDNQGPLFNVRSCTLAVADCNIDHHPHSLGTTNQLQVTATQWVNSSGDNEAFE